MGKVDLESRFERYADVMVEALGHADRATPARWYLRGLMLPGQRKSVEPMAARVHPEDVRSAHQSMHHLVADSQWSDAALFAAVARGDGLHVGNGHGFFFRFYRMSSNPRRSRQQ